VDPLRPGHELAYHPGEANLRMADVVVVNKVDTADLRAVTEVVANVDTVNPAAVVVEAASPATLDDGPSLRGARVLVVEDGPTITHGGMPYGAGTVAARAAGAQHFLDPRPFAVGSIAETYEEYPDIGRVLPAMGYGADQVRDLEATLQAAPCDVVVTGTPVDLSHVLDAGHPVRHVTYELAEVGAPDLRDALTPHLVKWMEAARGR
jgi:predicted GTPase